MTQHRRKREKAPATSGGVTLAIPPREQVKVPVEGWTVEHALYAMLVVLAGLLRFLWLDVRPLSPAEAYQAWLAWQDAQPSLSEPVVNVSPLAYTLQWALFLLTGGGDALARFWSALGGVLLVLLPYAFRQQLGRERALLTAGLLAFSPQLTYWSRHASGTSLLLLFGVGFIAALFGWLAADKETASHRLTWVALLGALLLMTTELAYTLLLIVLVGTWPLRQTIGQRWHDVGGRARRRAALVFGLALALGGSAFLTNIAALSNVADVLGRWVQRFWISANYPWYWVPWRLLADELLLVVFGAWGVWRAWQRRNNLDRLWLVWLGLALALGLLQRGRTGQDVALAVIPLAFLASDALYALWQKMRAPSPTWKEEWVLAGAYFIILAFWFMMAAGYLAVGDERYIPALLAVPVVLLGLTLMYRYWLSPTAAWRVILITLLITTLLWTWMALWVQNLHLAEDAALDALPGIEREMTHPNVRLLVQTMERISAQKATDLHEIPVDLLVGPHREVLRWYLRDFVNLREIRSVKAAGAPLVLTPAETPPPPGYTGMDWVLVVNQLPTELGGRIYHWWFYRQAPLGTAGERVILWYRPEAEAKASDQNNP